MENKKMDEMGAIVKAMGQVLKNDPNAPPALRAGIKVADAVQDLTDTAQRLWTAALALYKAEDVEGLQEIEQYASLVAEGIRQFLAATGSGGAP